MKRKGELTSNGQSKKETKVSKASLREERESLVLWRKPFTTSFYFLQELSINVYEYGTRLLQYWKSLLSISLVLIFLSVLMNIRGPHQFFLQLAKRKLLWSLYWVGLGVLSSIGLGTGLHTFLLYLGPHIASVTLAAYECGGLNFPEPPYPDDIICPKTIDPNWTVSIWNIIRKVHLEAIMWGAGTALGELPPYFMARAARLSGHDEDDEDLKEFEELQKKKKNKKNLTRVDRAKLLVEDLVNKVGFIGILVCASIPNPLFDLAGITCGHFLVPFWTFFGATLIGKAIIKMAIQTMFVIAAFSDVLISTILDRLQYIPKFGNKMQHAVQDILAIQRAKLHPELSSKNSESGGNPIGMVFELFVVAMVGYFVISIINSLAQSYHKRINKNEKSKEN